MALCDVGFSFQVFVPPQNISGSLLVSLVVYVYVDCHSFCLQPLDRRGLGRQLMVRWSQVRWLFLLIGMITQFEMVRLTAATGVSLRARGPGLRPGGRLLVHCRIGPRSDSVRL